MKKARKPRPVSAMLEENDFSNGVRGKYAKRYAERTNLILLSPDVAEYFPNSQAVNDALRALVKIATKKSVKQRA